MTSGTPDLPIGIFVSHASADHPLVDSFVDLLQRGAGIPANGIFYSSDPGTSVPTGLNFVDYIGDRLRKCSLAIQLITPSFLESHFCLCEMGAIWYAKKRVFPIVIPPVTSDQLRGVLIGIQAERICDPQGLDKLFDVIRDTIGANAKTAVWTGQRDRFLSLLPRALDQLRPFSQSGRLVADTDFPPGYPAPIKAEFLRSMRGLSFFKRAQTYDIEVVHVEEDALVVRLELSYVLVCTSELDQRLRLTFLPFRPTKYTRASVGDVDLDLRHPDINTERGLFVDHGFEPHSETPVVFSGEITYRRPDSDLFTTRIPALDFDLRLDYPRDSVRFVVESLVPDHVSPKFSLRKEIYHPDRPVLPYQGFRVHWI